MVTAQYMLLIRVVDKTLHVICIVHMTVHVVIASSVYQVPSLIIYTVKYTLISESQILCYTCSFDGCVFDDDTTECLKDCSKLKSLT